MRSVTSYFNSTLYHKTMARFWPLWALYGLGWLFAMPLSLLNNYFDCLRWEDIANIVPRVFGWAENIPTMLPVGVVLSCIFGVLCAMAVFSYLYNNRAAAMMHALPMKRETLFTTQYLAGLCFLLLPQLAVAVLTAAVEVVLLPSEYWGRALYALLVWLLVQSASALFFFSFAAFCAMFTGHILALPAFYGILNGLVVAVYSLLQELMGQFFYGYVGQYGGSLVAWCTPLASLMEASQWTIPWVNNVPAEKHMLQDPATVAIYAAAGVAFAVLALMVYQRRHVESAGDVVAIPLVRPIFQYGVAFCSGLCLGTFTAAFFGWQDEALPLSLCVLVWTAAGYFAAAMLLKKSFRVFRGWKGCVAMVAVMALLCFSFTMDLFGVVKKVPAPGQVESVQIDGNWGYPNDDGHLRLDEVTDPKQIGRIIDLHQAILDAYEGTGPNSDGYESGEEYLYFRVDYRLKDGSRLTRRYHTVPVFRADVDREGSLTWQANQMLQDRELVERCYNFDFCEKGRLVEARLEGVYNRMTKGLDTAYLDGIAAGEDLDRLWQAVRQDFDEGTIGVRYLFDDEARRENTYRTDLVFSWAMPVEKKPGWPADSAAMEEMTITLTPTASHTLAWMEERGVLDGSYTLADQNQQPVGGAVSSAGDGPMAEAVEIK